MRIVRAFWTQSGLSDGEVAVPPTPPGYRRDAWNCFVPLPPKTKSGSAAQSATGSQIDAGSTAQIRRGIATPVGGVVTPVAPTPLAASAAGVPTPKSALGVTTPPVRGADEQGGRGLRNNVRVDKS